MQRILGYYADWSKNLSPNQIDYRLFTHLCHAFAEIKPDGTLAVSERARPLIDRAKEHKTAVLLSVGGADSNKELSALLADKASFERMLDSLTAAVEKTGYAGIDVDWEAHDSPSDGERMNLLVSRLRQRLGKEHLLTMAAPASQWGGKWFDSATLVPLVDWLNVMNYDYHGPWSQNAGHNANLFPCPGDDGISTVTSIEYWTRTKGFPKEKLLLGIPSYGRGFNAKQLGDKIQKGKKAPHEYTEWRAIDALIRLGWKRQWDATGRVPYLLSPRGDEVLSYEDFESAQEKGAWAKKQGLGGIFFWEISCDFVSGTHHIVQGARRGYV